VAVGRALTALASVLGRLGDPGQEEAIEEALTLLEAQPPGPELVAAYAQLARLRFLGGAYPEAIAAAERALALAAELGLPEPAGALGYRCIARCQLGEREGLEDMRRALALALDQGQGGAAAVLHNNLALARWQYEGPQGALAACREGIDFCERRGITGFALGIGAMSMTFLAELGEAEQALAEAGSLAERTEAAGDVVFTELRSLQLRLLAERGSHQHAPAAEELVAAARESGEPQMIALAFAAAARLRRAEGRAQQAQALLAEVELVPGTRPDPYYASVLPGLVRGALALGDRELAARLVDGVQPVTPLHEYALAACRAQTAEAACEQAEAAALYAEAAEYWREFGNVPERAYALLGQGRSLAALAKPEAEVPLRQAKELFASMGYRPALAETGVLLGESEPAAV
jgi:tetratricopeptide (TPR) repeat protein